MKKKKQIQKLNMILTGTQMGDPEIFTQNYIHS